MLGFLFLLALLATLGFMVLGSRLSALRARLDRLEGHYSKTVSHRKQQAAAMQRDIDALWTALERAGVVKKEDRPAEPPAEKEPAAKAKPAAPRTVETKPVRPPAPRPSADMTPPPPAAAKRREAQPVYKEARPPSGSTKPSAPAPAPPQTPKGPEAPAPTRGGSPWDKLPSLEYMLGTQWLARAGVVLILVGLGLLLHYMYDTVILGPVGRLALTAMAGAAMVAAGEYFRRKPYVVLFQTLTGGGIGVFYLCVFFAHHIFDLVGLETAAVLAVGVTAAAILLAVIHNAQSIALLGLAGGFLTPFLFSDGGNQPYALFTYVTILNGVAVGVSVFRRWQWANRLALSGTALLYFAWYGVHYTPADLAPALLFTTVFYLIFLGAPLAHSLAQRKPEGAEGLAVIGVGAAIWLLSYYLLLYQDYPRALGFIVLAKAALLIGAHRLWVQRVPTDKLTGQSLLAMSLLLIALAVPLQLELYGVAIGWAVQGIVLAYVGARYGNRICNVSSMAALALAAGGLAYQLVLTLAPGEHGFWAVWFLHEDAFRPLLNPAFGAWAMVAAGCAASAWLAVRFRTEGGAFDSLPIAAGLLGYALLCFALTSETAAHWLLNRGDLAAEMQRVFIVNSLAILWAGIALATAFTVARRVPSMAPLAWIACAILGLVFAAGVAAYEGAAPWLSASWAFWSRLAVPAAMAGVLWILWDRAGRPARQTLECAAHGTLACLMALECIRWTGASEAVAQAHAPSFIAMAWAAHGLAALWRSLPRGREAGLWSAHALVMGAALAACAGLPLQDDAFSPILNVSFLGWAAVIGAATAGAMLIHRCDPLPEAWLKDGKIALLVTAYGAGCLLLSFETYYHWQYNRPDLSADLRSVYIFNSLCLLWAVIAIATAAASRRMGRIAATLTGVACAVAGLVFAAGVTHYEGASPWLGVSWVFWSRLAVIAAFFAAIRLLRNPSREILQLLEGAANAGLAILLALESLRWAGATALIDRDMGNGLISALWAIQGATLTWRGLVRDYPLRRYAGFALFGLAVAKTVVWDTAGLDGVYRIVSFIGSGFLLLVAGYLYQRYSEKLLGAAANEAGHEKP